MVKISSFMISIVLASLVVGIFGLFLADTTSNYDVSYDEDNLAVYNQLNNMSSQAESIQDQTEDISEKSGVLDVIGSYFSSAYQAMKLTAQSFGVFGTISNAAIDDANLGQAGGMIKVAIFTIVLIAIFVGVFVAALMKWGV